MKRKTITSSSQEDHKDLQKKAKLKRAYMEAAEDDARKELFKEWNSIDMVKFTFISPRGGRPKPGEQ